MDRLPDLEIDHALVDRFEASLEDLRCARPIGLAVSGGPDSMAMLLLAWAALDGAIEVATVDHGLRPEAAEECALVRGLCERLQLPCEVLHVAVAPGNVQDQAREARYAALLDWADRRPINALATAHHADDQVETVLMRLNRGSGLAGLGGIRRKVWFEGHKTPVVRPLLGFRRAELLALVERTGIAYARDPSNEDQSFDRVRLRKVLAGADWLDPLAIVRSAAHLAEADRTLDSIADHFWVQTAKADTEVVTVPRTNWLDTNARMIVRGAKALGCTLLLGDVMRLMRSGLVSRGDKVNLAGVLIEQGDAGYSIRLEPPRRTG